MTRLNRRGLAGATALLALCVVAARASADEPNPPVDGDDVVPCCTGPVERDAAGQNAARGTFRVAADPNNLPFSNERKEGFENRIAEVVARELGVSFDYEWRAQRRGFFRQTLKEGDVDLILGVPAGFEMALTTEPYYASTYVFVSRRDRNIRVTSFDDPVLRDLKVGVQLVGDDGTNTPPAHALAARGIAGNLVGYTLYGDYAQENPPARIVDAVARGDVDLAIVWGPLAGFHAKRQAVELDLVPVPPRDEKTGLPFAFAISMGVRKGNTELRDKLDALLVAKQPEIDAILDEFGVPRVPVEGVPVLADDDDDGPPERGGPK